MRNFRLFSAMLLAGILLHASGCASIVQSAAKKVWENRSTENQVADAKIHIGILDRVKNKDKSLLLDISVDVWEQRVMITGALADSNTRSEIESLARDDARIKALHNEIQVVAKAEKEARRKQKEKGGDEKSGIGRAVNDFWIEAKIKGQLLAESNVSSVNYFYRSVLNKVYVIGKADNSIEKQQVLSIIKGTEGVKSVTEYIEVGSDY